MDNIVENLVSKIAAILQLNTLLQDVYVFEKEDPAGTPFVTITPSGNEGQYATTSENERVYAFNIRLHVERKGQSNPENAERTMRALVSSVLDDLDKNWQLSGLTVPAGHTFLMMTAAPSRWGYIGRENEYRVAEINVRCKTYVDVTAIS